jgi:hypothetical protein
VLKDEQKTKKMQNVMTDSHAKVSGLIFASSSHNLKKTVRNFLEIFENLKFLYKTAIMFQGLKFLEYFIIGKV